MRLRPTGRGLRRRALHATVAVLGLTLLTAAPAAAAPTVGEVALDAPDAPVTAGDPVDVRLDLRGVDDVFAYEATLAFDPALLAFEAVTATPAGGFDDAAPAAGAVTVRHTRLGTSPALTGDVVPTTVRLRALAGGSATVRVATLRLVGADGSTATLTDAASATVVLAPAPTPEPTPEPTPDPVPTPDPSAPAAPAPTGAASPTATPAAVAAPGTGPRGGALSATGAQVGGLLALALGAVAVGVVLVRRRTAAAR